MNVQELERGITNAHENGDTATLRRLQEKYRSEVAVTRILPPSSIQIVERSQLSVVADPAPPVTKNRSTTTTTVVVRPWARHTIRNMGLTTERESGGWLVGHQDGDTLVVETVWAAKGTDHRGERDTIRLDAEWLGVVDEKAQRAGWKVIGDWHTHPVPSEPSARDEHGWLGQASGFRHDYLGLLLCPHEADMLEDSDRFRRPQWRGFLATPTGTLRPIALQFELSTEGD